jgi:hypothetical protein
MMRIGIGVLAVLTACQGAYAQGCMRSLDTILNGARGSLPLSAQSYQHLYETCVQTLALGNVRKAYVLLDGGIAVIPQHAGVLATAETLAAFCRKFPKGRLRFILRGDLVRRPSVALIVMLSSQDGPSCRGLLGHS